MARRYQHVRSFLHFTTLSALFFVIALGGCSSTNGVASKQVTATKTPIPTATATITPMATPVPPSASLSAQIDQYIATMSLNAKIGQMLVLQFVTVGYIGDSVTMMRDFQPGALILYKYELPDAATVSTMTSAIQHDAHIPLLITADQEGGFIDQLIHIYGQTATATDIGYTHNPSYAYAQGVLQAQHLKSLGFNADLAPDVDVQTVNGPDQSTRTFGYNQHDVTMMAGPFLDGLQNTGVVGTLKHFPGLGAAYTDAHLGLPVIHETPSQIDQIDLTPYRNLFNGPNPPGMVMTTDLLMPVIDQNLPAEISPAIITGLLRNQLHYNGVVMTDALYMKGISNEYDQYQAGVKAIAAGCDLLLGPANSSTARTMVQTIADAVHNGTLTEARIDQSVHRILMLKATMLGWVPPASAPPLQTQAYALGPVDLTNQS